MGAIDSDALKEYIKKTDLTAVERGALLQAISNMPTLTPPNEPLTLEELREMKGQPVWTVTTGLDGSGRWELVCDVDYEDVLEMASCVDGFYAIEMDTYGSTWTAYRRPPEGEANA